MGIGYVYSDCRPLPGTGTLSVSAQGFGSVVVFMEQTVAGYRWCCPRPSAQTSTWVEKKAVRAINT